MIFAPLIALTGFPVSMPPMVLDVRIGLLQAYTSSLMVTVYVGAAIRVGEESAAGDPDLGEPGTMG